MIKYLSVIITQWSSIQKWGNRMKIDLTEQEGHQLDKDYIYPKGNKEVKTWEEGKEARISQKTQCLCQ